MISHRRKGFQFLLKDGESFQFLLKDGGRGFSFPLRKLKGIFHFLLQDRGRRFSAPPYNLEEQSFYFIFRKQKDFQFLIEGGGSFSLRIIILQKWSWKKINTVKETKIEHIFSIQWKKQKQNTFFLLSRKKKSKQGIV